MDILSHGLWAAAVGKGAQIDKKQDAPKLPAKWLIFFGMFPDLFAFVPIFVWSLVSLVTGGGSMIHRPPTELEPWTPGFNSLSNATEYLYQISHSLVIFILVVLVIYIVRRKIPWILLGWPLHILADIPTHSYQFYPTPFLWPLFNFKFDGFSWGSNHFTIYNYIALAVVYLLLYVLKKYNKR